MTSLNLLVLRCADIEKSKAFYMTMGLTFVQEQHGKGPVHYSCTLGKMVIELYPIKETAQDKTRLGFDVNNLERILLEIGATQKEPGYAVVKDPDGRNVELRAYPKPI